ncbi:homeodomain-interacting protein kinase 1-like [Sebastes umbrosus]|uniref:homeodomain-interacting protein kinase 1-like n=1 Tax=Sebastes umbrosus TaxID=72105 RepID=UPI0018A08852|nr:homeodomain-interacting protein kinase 1-like [Sebastes umbrosus]
MSSSSSTLMRNDILCSKSTRYTVLDLHGAGSYGKVAKCVNLKTNRLVAIKIHNWSKNYAKEVAMLKAVRVLDPEKKNIVRFIENFTFKRLSCLAFEMLDKSLWELMQERNYMPLTLNEIRPVVYQLLVAFEALKSIGIVHADLKPDNIMLVNHRNKPFKVKLIDFGLACPVSKLQDGVTIQIESHRAPEVTLGLPLSEAVDMWGMGCVMSFMYFGVNLFRGKSAYRRMKAMVHMLGQPEDHLLDAGKNTWQYFSREEGSSGPRWRLKTPLEYKDATGDKARVAWEFFDTARNLEDAVQNFPEKTDALEFEDRMEFLSLLKSCLHLDAGKRDTPREALLHKFVTLAHLVDEDTSSYADQAFDYMNMSNLQSVEKSDQTSNSSDGISGTDSSSDEEPDPRALKIYLKKERCEDADADTSSGEDDIESATSGSCYGHYSTPSFSEGEIPAGLKSESSSSTVSDEDDIESDSSGSCDGDSSLTSFSEGEESVAATYDDNTDTGFVPVVCNTNDDGASATSTGGAAASITSEDGAAAAIGPDDVKKKKKRNVFQRTRKFFSRVEARVRSIFKCHN